MKLLTVYIGDGDSCEHTIGDSAEMMIEENGSLALDDFEGTEIVYAAGQFVSATLERIKKATKI